MGTVLQLSLGSIYAWSFFQKPLVEGYHWSNSQVAWTFSLAIGFLGVAAAIGGVSLPRYGPRKLAIIGSFLHGLGYLLAALALQWKLLALLWIGFGMIGGVGLVLCLLAARFLFHVPMVGSLALLLLMAMLYMLVAVAIGLLIFKVTRNQFIASQVALLASFLPAMMLSGFLFDLRNVPRVVYVIGQLLPATHFMEVLRTLFLAGNIGPLVLKNGLLLLGYVVLLLAITRRITRKSLD